MIAGSILVAGGNGRLGRQVLTLLGERGVAIARGPMTDHETIIVGDDGRIDPAEFADCAAVINCAGRIEGDLAAIERANVDYPVRLARAAKEAGVPRFVQVSSFSIFGNREFIDHESPLAPSSAYGRSKVTAEASLLALDAPAFHVTPLRLPFMFSAENAALLGALVTMMRRVRFLPSSPNAPSRRSMITYSGAADALVACALSTSSERGPQAAADPQPMALTGIANAISRRLGIRIAIVPVPSPIIALVDKVSPAISTRLFRSSILADAINVVKEAGPHSVEHELSRYLSRLAAGRLDNNE